MTRLEPIWYEIFPYLCLCIGVAAVTEANRMAGVFGASLLMTSILIIRDRYVYRRQRRALYALARSR
jgi:hypothetical protein